MRGVRYFVAKLNWFLYFVSVVTIELCSVRLAPGRPRPKPWDTGASACKRLEIALSCTENPLDKVCLCILKIVNDNLRCGSQLRGLGSSHTIALSHCQGCEVRTHAIVIVVGQLDHIMTVIIVGSFFGGSSIITLHAWLKTMCFDFIIIIQRWEQYEYNIFIKVRYILSIIAKTQDDHILFWALSNITGHLTAQAVF